MISFENLVEDIWLVRYHSDEEDYGSDYHAICTIHKENNRYYVKGFIARVRINFRYMIEEVKKYFNTNKLYIRKTDLTYIKVI